MADLYHFFSGILLFYLFFVDYLVRGGKYTTFWQSFTVVDKKVYQGVFIAYLCLNFMFYTYQLGIHILTFYLY